MASVQPPATRRHFTFDLRGLTLNGYVRDDAKVLLVKLRKTGADEPDEEYMRYQLVLYGLSYPPAISMNRQKLKKQLMDQIDAGQCDKVQASMEHLEDLMRQEYMAARQVHLDEIGPPAKQAEHDLQMFLSNYFLDKDGRPDPSKARKPMALHGYSERARLEAEADQIEGLHVTSGGKGANRTTVIGWSHTDVWSMAARIDLEQKASDPSQMPSASSEAAAQPEKASTSKPKAQLSQSKSSGAIAKDDSQTPKKLQTGKRTLPADERDRVDAPATKKLQTARGGPRMDVVAHQTKVLASITKVQQGQSKAKTTPKTGKSITSTSNDRPYGDFHPSDATGLFHLQCDAIAKQWNASRMVLRMKCNGDDQITGTFDLSIVEGVIHFAEEPGQLPLGKKSSFQSQQTAKKGNKPKKEHPRRLYLMWRGRETGEGHVFNSTDQRGHVDFDDDFNSFTGEISMPFVGPNTAFEGTKIDSSFGPFRPDWSEYSDEQDEYEKAVMCLERIRLSLNPSLDLIRMGWTVFNGYPVQ